MASWVGVVPTAVWLCAATAPLAMAADVGIEFTYDDNVPRAQLAKDRKGDHALGLSLAAGPHWQVSDRDSLEGTVSLASTAYYRYDALDHLSAGVALAYKRKLGLGAYAPGVAVSAAANRLDYRSALRDGWLYAAEVGGEQHLSERWELRAAYRFERRKADEAPPFLPNPAISGAVFDLAGRSLAVNADFSWQPALLLSLGYILRDGDIVSTSTRNRPVYLASSAIAADPVFGPDTFAYRISGLTHSLHVGLSQLVQHHASWTVAYERVVSHGDGEIDYRANMVRATYLHSF